MEEGDATVQVLLVALLTGSFFAQWKPSKGKARTRGPAQLGIQCQPSSKPWLGVEAELTDKTTWAASSTIYTMVNHGSLLRIWSSLLYLQGSLPATHHKPGLQLLLIPLTFLLKPGLTTGEVRRRNQRGDSSGVELSADSQSRVYWPSFVFCFGAKASHQLWHLAFGPFRGLSASAGGQEEVFAWALKVAS